MKTYVAIFVAMVCSLMGCTAQNKYQNMDVEAFEKLISNADVVRLDVRTAQEYGASHLLDAINIDVQKGDFEAVAKQTLPKDKTIAVYCRSGKRSLRAAELLAKNGFAVANLNTGFAGWQSAKKPTTKEEVDLFVTSKGTCVYAYCIKHGTLRLRVGETWIYVDPVTDKVPPVTDFTNMNKADLILVTHNHPDHLDMVAIKQLQTGKTKIVANPQSAEAIGADAIVMKNGDSQQFDNIKVDAVAAYNNSADKLQFHPKGRDNGYVLTIDEMRIYIAGDTEDIPEMAELESVDIAFLPCNLPFTMTPEQLVKVANQVMKPSGVLFPYHYGQTDIQQVSRLLAGSSIDVRIRQYQ